jgi:hypothetical protein
VDVLSSLPARWRPHFADTGRALAPVDHNPHRYNRAVARWAGSEPSLCGLRAETVFAEPHGGLSECQARAMIRIARSDDQEAELAGWSLVWQFGLAIIGMASRERLLPGSQGPRAAVCTATAEIWRLISHINLETNQASIFYAITTKARRAVLPCTHWISEIDRHTVPVENPDEASLNSKRVQCCDPVELDDVDWLLTTERLTAPLVAAVVERCQWDQQTRYFEPRCDRLRAFIAWRLDELTTGEHRSLPDIAAELDQSIGSVKNLQICLHRTSSHLVDLRGLLVGC